MFLFSNKNSRLECYCLLLLLLHESKPDLICHFFPPKWMVRNWPFPAQNITTSIFMLITLRPRFENANNEKQVMHESAVFFPLLSCFVLCVPNARPYELNSVAVLATHSEKKTKFHSTTTFKITCYQRIWFMKWDFSNSRGDFLWIFIFYSKHWITPNEPNSRADWSFFPFQFNFLFFLLQIYIEYSYLKITNGFLSWKPRFLM